MKDNEPDPLSQAHLDTLAVRAGIERTAEGEHAEPIFATSSYVFENAAQAAARFSGDVEGNVYSRYTNPTVRTFEQRIAALEGAEAAVATASGNGIAQAWRPCGLLAGCIWNHDHPVWQIPGQVRG